MTHDQAKNLKADIELLGYKIQNLIKEKEAKENLLHEDCPHVHHSEWDDGIHVWRQCSLCLGDAKIIKRLEEEV